MKTGKLSIESVPALSGRHSACLYVAMIGAVQRRIKAEAEYIRARRQEAEARDYSDPDLGVASAQGRGERLRKD